MPSPRDEFVRTERYDMLLDEELPVRRPRGLFFFLNLFFLQPLPTEVPPISNIGAYKNYMVLRYEYQKRGLLEEPAPKQPEPKAVPKPTGPKPPRPPLPPQKTVSDVRECAC